MRQSYFAINIASVILIEGLNGGGGGGGGVHMSVVG